MSRSARNHVEVGRLPGAYRWVALVVLSINAALVIALSAEGSVLGRPGGPRYVISALVALTGYAIAVIALTGVAPEWVQNARLVGVIVGTATGVMWLLNLLIETFAGLTGWRNLAATAPLLLGGFVLWGVAGALARRRARSLAAGPLAAVVAAMTCVSITLVLGFALPFLALPRLAQNIDGSPEYLSSGWQDLHAFAIANTLDAGFTHLLVAPIIAVVTGTLGAVAAGIGRHAKPPD